MNLYDSDFIAKYFDNFGEREWSRLVNTPSDEVKLYIHSYYLQKYIKAGDLVLDIGAGAGRFTQVLATLGAMVTVADISQRQLDLNKQFAEDLGFSHAVKGWLRLDVCDMAALADQTFDAVVCYGGPLSYVFDKRDQALSQILRVLKPSGVALLSVMALWGCMHEALPGILTVSAEKNAEIIRTGNLYFDTGEGLRHRCHLFRSGEFIEYLRRHNVSLLSLSTSNCISTVWADRLGEVRSNPARWEELLAMELEACQQPGCLDMGTHLIAAVERRN